MDLQHLLDARLIVGQLPLDTPHHYHQHSAMDVVSIVSPIERGMRFGSTKK